MLAKVEMVARVLVPQVLAVAAAVAHAVAVVVSGFMAKVLTVPQAQQQPEAVAVLVVRAAVAVWSAVHMGVGVAYARLAVLALFVLFGQVTLEHFHQLA